MVEFTQSIVSDIDMNQFYSHIFFFIFLISTIVIKGEVVSLKLSLQDEVQLQEFIHAMMWGSQLGYVLYGNKPMCFESYVTGSYDNTGKLSHHMSTRLSGGLPIWRKLKLPQESEKYLLLINENDPNSCRFSHIFFINKRAFHQVVNENLAIFRYILGPNVTADKLLNALRKEKCSVFSLLNDNNLLIGLLLGFGFENALYVSRQEQIRDAMNDRDIGLVDSNFGSYSFFTCLKRRPIKDFSLIKKISLSPSMGYSTLEKELNLLDQTIIDASATLEKYQPELIFGRVIGNNQLSTELVTNYEEDQLQIIRILDSPNWLQKVLSDFCCEKLEFERSNGIEEIMGFQIPSDIVVAQVIHDAIQDDCSDALSGCFQMYLKGMQEADVKKDAAYQFPYLRNRDYDRAIDSSFLEGFILWSFYKNCKEVFNLEDIIDNLRKIQLNGSFNIPKPVLYNCLREVHSQIYTNLKFHEEFLAKSEFDSFHREPNLSDCRALVKNYLYYKQIRGGDGSKISLNKPVKVSYVLKSVSGFVFTESKEGEWLDLKRTYRGFREGFPQMSIGEKGVLYIHPEWGFKSYLAAPHFPPYLIAEFELLSQ